MMAGGLLSFWGPAYFQGRTVKLQVGKSISLGVWSLTNRASLRRQLFFSGSANQSELAVPISASCASVNPPVSEWSVGKICQGKVAKQCFKMRQFSLWELTYWEWRLTNLGMIHILTWKTMQVGTYGCSLPVWGCAVDAERSFFPLLAGRTSRTTSLQSCSLKVGIGSFGNVEVFKGWCQMLDYIK